jgi:hypothetical protein
VIAGYNGEVDLATIGANDERFEDLFRREADFRGDTLGREVVGIDFVFAQLVCDVVLIEEANGVGLHGFRLGPRANRKWAVAVWKGCTAPKGTAAGRMALPAYK